MIYSVWSALLCRQKVHAVKIPLDLSMRAASHEHPASHYGMSRRENLRASQSTEHNTKPNMAASRFTTARTDCSCRVLCHSSISSVAQSVSLLPVDYSVTLHILHYETRTVWHRIFVRADARNTFRSSLYIVVVGRAARTDVRTLK